MARVKLLPAKAFNRAVVREGRGLRATAPAAEKIATLARMHAAPHGTLASRINVEHGDVDSFVVMSDAGKGKNEPAAAAIEFGGQFKDGRIQPGLNILGQAVRSAGIG